MKKSKLLMVLIPMVIFCPLAIDIFLSALPVMARDMTTDIATIQWTVTLFILSMGIGQLIFGPLSDRLGRRPIALFGIFTYGISAFLMFITEHFEMHLLLRFFQGLGACSIMVTAFASVRDRLDTKTSSAVYSYLNGAICCIPALAPVLGYFLSKHFDWHSTFLFMASFALIAGVFVFYNFDESLPRANRTNLHSLSITNFTSIISNPMFSFHALLIMLTMAIIISYVSSAPSWLMDKLGLDQQAFTLWFSINAAINIFACITAPSFITRFGIKRIMEFEMWLLISASVILFVQPQQTSDTNYMLPVMICSLGFSLLMGVATGQALSPFKNNAGTASALLGFIQMSGASALVMLLQWLNLNAIQQLQLLTTSILFIYILWKLPKYNVKLTLN
ncbi:MAG: multidrug effflux MFS transporter [Parashewanella sp.]